MREPREGGLAASVSPSGGMRYTTLEMLQRGRSVRTRIVAGFAMLILAFGSVAGYSLSRQARAVESLRLANEGYLRLTLLLGEARATQGKLDTLLDRLLDERDRVNSRTWIHLARRTRRGVLARGRSLAAWSLPRARSPEDVALLSRALSELQGIDRTYEQDEPLFEELFQALASGRGADAVELKDRLLVREGATEDVLASLTRVFERRVEELSAQAESLQRRSLFLALVATAVAVALGGVTTLSARRALNPLALLRDRARAVARGELSPVEVPAHDDEIGELAREFERMVGAVAARDAALRTANVELQAAERHLEQVVASLRAAVLVVRPGGAVASANPAAVRLHDGRGLEGEDCGSTVFGREPEVERAVRDVARDAPPRTFEAVRLGERAFDVTVVPFLQGEVRSGALVVADDVTDREDAKTRWIQAERLAAIGRMAAHVTHEVRNPLSSIALNAEMLADELSVMGAEGGEATRLVAAIQKEVDRLTGITEEYLRVARLPRPRLEREDAGTIVSEALGFVTQEMAAAGVEVTLTVEDGLEPVLLDEAQVRQALLNLFRNAREAMESRSEGARRLEVTVRGEGAGVALGVRDTGPGITPEARAHLFELFFTTKARGTGLGLPLTREIIAAHGGTLTVESPEDGGTRFVIFLPRARAREEDGRDAA